MTIEEENQKLRELLTKALPIMNEMENTFSYLMYEHGFPDEDITASLKEGYNEEEDKSEYRDICKNVEQPFCELMLEIEKTINN